MSELPGSHESEITDDAKRMLIDIIRATAPHYDQPVDEFGVYITNFFQDAKRYTSIYIPSLASFKEDDVFIDDAVRVIERTEEVLGNGYMIVHNKVYKISEPALIASYDENDYVVDVQTGKHVAAPPLSSLAKRLETYDLEKKLKPSPVFTYQRMMDLGILLASLDPNATF